jgi:dimethylamine/trimethylamine dehydrogenase
MGEEWRRGWHPEKIPAKKSNKEILIVGAGPSGLECARAMGQRGYPVTLVDSKPEFGGRVLLESRLPGLSEWRRVAEWRLSGAQRRDNVQMFPASHMTAKDILDTGIRDIIVATGARYRRDGVGRSIHYPISGYETAKIFTPDDIMDGQTPEGQVVIYDDDHFYMGGVIAELLANKGCDVTIITPSPMVSYWTQFTLEQEKIQSRLMGLGVKFSLQHKVLNIGRDVLTASCVITGRENTLKQDAIVFVTDRTPNDQLYKELLTAHTGCVLDSLRLIGDAEAPGTIAQAVFAGHLAAREFDEIINPDVTPFRVERTGQL